MSATVSHHANLRLEKDYVFIATFPDLPDAAPMMFDEPAPLGSGRAPQAVDVLSASVGNCLAASLAFCLRKARVHFTDLEARVTTEVTRDDRGRMRVGNISVELLLGVSEPNPAGVDRCRRIFEDFCTVTASIREGIGVIVKVRERNGVDAGAINVS